MELLDAASMVFVPDCRITIRMLEAASKASGSNAAEFELRTTRIQRMQYANRK